ncbi:MAG: HAMP domain-containing sensor histidine kinase [Eubacteriaceae bacterium]|nr:HAMP domain-containing sensor histidine kinase [Eubacteriaceae bacterium]
MGILWGIIAVLLGITLGLGIRQYRLRKRTLEMIAVIDSILAGQKKRQIFSKEEDALGRLAYGINQLATRYGTAQEKYEEEQLAKKQLIANLSHDVRTPLVSVIGYLEAIVQHRIAGDQQEDYIRTAYTKANVLKERVNQLFELVQSDANEIALSPKRVDVCEITRQVLIDILPVLEGEHIALDSSIPDDEWYLWVDPERFTRILQNLIKNTLTHAGQGKYLGVFLKREAGHICIDIADKGEGIDASHQPHVFERLYKADHARLKGGGLGLAIAKELCDKMGGTIAILRSIPGDTVFRITFPEAQ